ncbi:hypothetical protein JQ597_28830 [Bradyrhizobium sp. AUGA SZCCT0177]|uniref:hypothetical protein n=1 Tax=Bradyrhizobium sp. AUGA SZCCT0177 TaxID=2807665 RepID=UPI001BA44DF0|nr:hypothetical protein [Bradyrhizobium sp. AUGA SZCCT0177]MBR1286063.1 hypothetical protein [Bradyrhizobium sp. AUGA SZCCT0177]
MKPDQPAELRHCLAKIQRHCRVELANISLAAAWPLVSRLVESNCYTDADRRADAVERFSDDLVTVLNECRQRIRACDAVIEREERKARVRAG